MPAYCAAVQPLPLLTRVVICAVRVTWKFVPEISTSRTASDVLVVETLVKVMLIGVRAAGPSMSTALAAFEPEVVRSPEVTVIPPVLFCASSPRWPAAGEISRSAKLMEALLLDKRTPAAVDPEIVVPPVTVNEPPVLDNVIPVPVAFVDEMLVNVADSV